MVSALRTVTSSSSTMRSSSIRSFIGASPSKIPPQTGTFSLQISELKKKPRSPGSLQQGVTSPLRIQISRISTFSYSIPFMNLGFKALHTFPAKRGLPFKNVRFKVLLGFPCQAPTLLLTIGIKGPPHIFLVNSHSPLRPSVQSPPEKTKFYL